MRLIRALIGPLVIPVLIVTSTAAAQTTGPTVGTVTELRPGTTIQADQLGEFVAKSITVSYPGQVVRASLRVRVSLRLKLLSHGEGVIGEWESKTVEMGPDMTYPGSIWIPAPDEMNIFAPGFGERRKITLGQVLVVNHEEQYMPRECEEATHALRIDVGQGDGVLDDERMREKEGPWTGGQIIICLNVSDR